MEEPASTAVPWSVSTGVFIWSSSEWEVMVSTGGEPSAISMVTSPWPVTLVVPSLVDRPREALKVWGVLASFTVPVVTCSRMRTSPMKPLASVNPEKTEVPFESLMVTRAPAAAPPEGNLTLIWTVHQALH